MSVDDIILIDRGGVTINGILADRIIDQCAIAVLRAILEAISPSGLGSDSSACRILAKCVETNSDASRTDTVSIVSIIPDLYAADVDLLR